MSEEKLLSIIDNYITGTLCHDKVAALSSYDGPVHVEWEDFSRVTQNGNLAFFIDFLKTSKLFDNFVSDFPLEYKSNNKSSRRDILGTILLSILSGHRRYSHITSIRNDNVNPHLLGMKRIVSEDSVRRGISKLEEDTALSWVDSHLHFCYEPLLTEPWILDVDTTVKCLYGKQQEGAAVGYNPTKPGRPSHTYHTYMIANLRMVLGVEVLPGNESHSSTSSPRLFSLLDNMLAQQRPAFIRGDSGFGTNKIMLEAELRGIDYLFKLRCTKKVKQLISVVMTKSGWCDAGQGWEGKKSKIQLSGWTSERSVVVMRRLLDQSNIGMLDTEEATGQKVFSFMKTLPNKNIYEYAVLVTSLDDEVFTIAQHYRDRSDCENVFDELKNQWGWSGFTTKDLKRCRVMANINALVYNWWSIFSRLCIPHKRHEAITSRPMLMSSVAKLTTHARQTKLSISTMHGMSKQIQKTLEQAAQMLHFIRNKIIAGAEQLTQKDIWRYIVSAAMRFFLKGRILKPPTIAITNN